MMFLQKESLTVQNTV